MLKLTNINKTYKMTNFNVEALKDINLSFRENEFVSILGPSGSGKTTLLNLVGGLDQYTSGDLIINGRSTKTFKERDWDVYRNHRVGFIFQSYNLIPHQTVLSNVELALTIAGLSKEERVKKAKEALDKVGLSDQYYKKPNQLSGGQSQRVAIARALVNDPEILLADEPTGALDTKTSKQIMELIKEVASDKLVIMVTHNPDLANEYSNRIINLLDGRLQDDSNPLVLEEETKVEKIEEEKVAKKEERAKMSWWTTFKLSLQNLFSKRNRTILTSIASSIGIIGISLVLSLSFGMKLYISNMQNDMLSGNPITVETNTLDLEGMMNNMGFVQRQELIKKNGYVNVQDMIKEITNRAIQTEGLLVENNISKDYIEFLEEIPEELIATLFFDYEIDIKNGLYLDFFETHNGDSTAMSLKTVTSIYTSILKDIEETKVFANLINNFTDIIKQSPSNETYLLEQYNILEGEIATNKDEIMLVLNNDRSINDLILAQLGYFSQEEFINVVLGEIDHEAYNPALVLKDEFLYSELMSKTFMWYPNDSIYDLDSVFVDGKVKTTFDYHAYEDNVMEKENGIELKIVGILEPKESISYGSLRSGFYYTEELTNHILEVNRTSKIAGLLNTFEGALYSGEVRPSEIPEFIPNLSFEYSYKFLDQDRKQVTGYMGTTNTFASLIPSDTVIPEIYKLSINDVGGSDIPTKISIYAKDLKNKPEVIKYLNSWNDVEGRLDGDKITLTDPLTLIFAMINSMINAITIALIGFTTLALVVSSVMIAIITYVSVVERIKEIGVIRSLGGRKRDVSNLFIAETAIIGLVSGTIAILFTYFASFIINFIVTSKIGGKIAVFPWHYALIMLSISIGLTIVSGLIPSRSAAKKDPVVALRTE